MYRAVAAGLLLSACSLKTIALGSVADALSSTGTSFSSDDDPELIADAVPFALKTMESLIPELPQHWQIRVSACSGFTQYAFAFVVTPSKLAGNLASERAAAARAKKLLIRARNYCIAALEIRHPGMRATLADKDHLSDKSPTIAALEKDDVPALYWLSASTALAVTSNKEQVDMLAEMPVVDVLIHRALAIEPDWDRGTLWEFIVSFDGGRSEAMGGSAKRAREAFDKAMALNKGERASPYVSLAETVSVDQQNKKEFTELLHKALAVDVDKDPASRLSNILAQRRATKLLAQADDLILGDD
jgi:predicted anti-sigma-YlaC factor YlaD